MKAKTLILLFVTLPIVCYGQKKEFKEASKRNSIESYTEFLEQYPNSKFSEAAKEKKTNLCIYWGKQVNKSSSSDLKKFLNLCPETDNRAQIETLIEELRENIEWDKALKENTYETFEIFQHNFPNSKRIEKAKKRAEKVKNRMEDLEWKSTIEYDTKEAYNNFILRFPNTKRKNKVDSILIALNTNALPRAAKKGNVEKVSSLITNADVDMKSHALMEAVWGALYTSLAYEWKNEYSLVFLSKRLAKTPRESYVAIIEFLLKNNANPKRFAFEDFGSVEVREKASSDNLVKQVSKTGYGEVRSQIGGDLNLNLIPFGTGGLSIKEVAEIHKADDILILLKK